MNDLHDDELHEAFSAMLERTVVCVGCGGLGLTNLCEICTKLNRANHGRPLFHGPLPQPCYDHDGRNVGVWSQATGMMNGKAR